MQSNGTKNGMLIGAAVVGGLLVTGGIAFLLMSDWKVEDSGTLRPPEVVVDGGEVTLPEVEIREGNIEAPEVKVVREGEIRAPDISVDTPDVNVGTKEVVVEVPTIDVDLPDEKDPTEEPRAK